MRQPLTAHEKRILSAAADGLTNREIGNSFFVSEETIKSHVKHILEKLGARNRTHAVALAYRDGLLVPAGR